MDSWNSLSLLHSFDELEVIYHIEENSALQHEKGKESRTGYTMKALDSRKDSKYFLKVCNYNIATRVQANDRVNRSQVLANTLPKASQLRHSTSHFLHRIEFHLPVC